MMSVGREAAPAAHAERVRPAGREGRHRPRKTDSRDTLLQYHSNKEEVGQSRRGTKTISNAKINAQQNEDRLPCETAHTAAHAGHAKGRMHRTRFTTASSSNPSCSSVSVYGSRWRPRHASTDVRAAHGTVAPSPSWKQEYRPAGARPACLRVPERHSPGARARAIPTLGQCTAP